MADFQNQSETPYYEILTPGKTETQKNPIIYQSSNEVNQQTYNYGNNAIYRSPCDFKYCTLFIFIFFSFFVSTIVMISVGIFEDSLKFKLLSFFPLIILTFVFIVGCTNNIFVVINISPSLGTIVITKRRLWCCFAKKEIVQINDVQEVIVHTQNYSVNVIFKLSNGREVYGLSKIYDENEGRKAYKIIKNALPERISFSGNLAY